MKKRSVFSIVLLTVIMSLPVTAQKGTDNNPESQELPGAQAPRNHVIDVMLEWLGTPTPQNTHINEERDTAIQVLLGMRKLAVEPLIGVVCQANRPFLARTSAIDCSSER